MKLDTFFDNFGLLADSPNGVQKLREMILQLAVQGKLVPQDPKDEPASILLEKIKAKKEQLIKEKKIKKSKLLPTVKSEETYYELPDVWVWTRLAEIGLINPKNEVNDETEVSFVPMKLVPKVLGDHVESEIRQWVTIKKGFTHFSEGDVALAKITPCFQNRKSVVMRGLKNGLGAGTTELYIFRPLNNLIISEYVLLYLKTPKFINEGVSKMTGSAGQKRVPKTYFSETAFPLPPANEQKRIVAKVDELMALCDELEIRKQQVSMNCVRLNDASIHKLLTARELKKFSNHWQRICDSFDLLYSKPENVTKLRQAVLQLAVQGKLVPQDPKDEPASVLLEKIKAEKERLIKEGKIKKAKPLPPIGVDEIPFKLPFNWVWVRLGSIAHKIGSGSTPRGGRAVYQKSGIKFLRSQNVWNSGLKLDDVAHIPSEIHDKMAGTKVLPKDILLNITGASIGRCSLVPEDFDEGNVSQHVSIIRLVLIRIRGFMHLCLISPYIQNLIMNVQVGMSREGLSKGRLELFLVPIPPENEQKRIVAKVDELMALCDKLETSLSQSQTDCDRLMEAAVADILAA